MNYKDCNRHDQECSAYTIATVAAIGKRGEWRKGTEGRKWEGRGKRSDGKGLSPQKKISGATTE